MHTYSTEQLLPIDIHTAWAFFSSPKNLAVITPAELDFKILTDLGDNEIYDGMIIDYKVKPLLGIPLHWQTEICQVKKDVSFTDRQVKGPYKIWEHTHTFIEMSDGIIMKDEVNYQLPFGVIGDIMHSLVVKNKIKHIFDYRRQVLHKLFISNGYTNN